MAKAKAKLRRIKSRFAEAVEEERSFVLALPGMRRVSGRRAYKLTNLRIERLAEVAFLIVFISWEQFLERAFEECVLGSEHEKLWVKVGDITTARSLIREGRAYAEWSDPEEVRKRAQTFFKRGAPFDGPLEAVQLHVKHMKTVRNQIAHGSGHANKTFLKLLRGLHGSSMRMTAGRFLLSPPPSAALPSGLPTGASYSSVFQLYTDILLTAATKITK